MRLGLTALLAPGQLFVSLAPIAESMRSATSSWYYFKLFAERSISFSSDSLHVLTGVLIQLASGLLLNRAVSSWAPWLVVFILACLNEVIDLSFDHWPELAIQYGESAKDLALTMALPTGLMITARHFPNLFTAPRQ